MSRPLAAARHVLPARAPDTRALNSIAGHDAVAIRTCLSWAFRSSLDNVLFQTQDDLEAIDQLDDKDKITRRRLRRVYCAETLPDASKHPKVASSIDGIVGFAHELVVVHQDVADADVQVVNCSRGDTLTCFSDAMPSDSDSREQSCSAHLAIKRAHLAALRALCAALACGEDASVAGESLLQHRL